jgi:hypothetical protein
MAFSPSFHPSPGAPNFDPMNRKKLPILHLSVVFLALLFSGCERLGNGIVQEIEFPTHTPQLAVTLISRPMTDTLVARAQTSAGILDTTGSKRLKNALFTLTHEDGASYTWGGQTDWLNGIGHVLPNAELAAGLWTLECEEENFETATATQMVPPQIDSLGDYLYATTVELNSLNIDEYSEGDITKYFVDRNWTLELSLPDRSEARDFFILRPQQVNDAEEDEFWSNSTWISPEIEDDTRMNYNGLARGWMIEDISDANSLNSLRFEVNQFVTGDDLEALLTPAKLELAALSPELSEYYRTLELIENPSGGPLFTEPLLAYSNMSSGFGCFGLYTSCELELPNE